LEERPVSPGNTSAKLEKRPVSPGNTSAKLCAPLKSFPFALYLPLLSHSCL
jgi:hypothetical protein